jgi:hypothetical protein
MRKLDRQRGERQRKREREDARERVGREAGWWRGETGGRVDTFEEGSVDAVTPASQWLLRHSSARAHASFRAGLNERTRRNPRRRRTPTKDSARTRRAVVVSSTLRSRSQFPPVARMPPVASRRARLRVHDGDPRYAPVTTWRTRASRSRMHRRVGC